MIIVGGGVAGAAAACWLAAHRPLLLEREAGEHDKVCGEFLSVETQRYLAALGLDPLALGAAPITHVRLASGTQLAQARLPFPALGLSRRRLDTALLEQAERLGARVERGTAVRRLSPGRVETGRGALASPALFAATGKHALRGVERPAGGDLVGFKHYFRLAEPARVALEGAVELIIFPGGYAGLQLVEGARANLCLLLHRGRAIDGATALEAALAGSPHLARRLAGAEPLLARPLAIANLPYGMIHRAGPEDPPGLFRLGDQFGMIPSFTGDGMAVVLHSARLAARAWAEGGAAAAPAYHRRARRELGTHIRLASGIAAIGLLPGAGPALVALGRRAPALLRAAARATRVPAAALARAG